LCYKEEKKGKRGYCVQRVGPAAKALVVGQLIVGNSMRQVSAVTANIKLNKDFSSA